LLILVKCQKFSTSLQLVAESQFPLSIWKISEHPEKSLDFWDTRNARHFSVCSKTTGIVCDKQHPKKSLRDFWDTKNSRNFSVFHQSLTGGF